MTEFITTNLTNYSVSIPPCAVQALKIHYPMYLAGTCMSMLSCLAAFIVYIIIREKIFHRSGGQYDRDGTKHWIHCNFILSFLLRDTGVIISVYLYYNGPTSLTAESLIESLLIAFVIYTVYAIIANFWWMFAEGLWIYLGVFLPNEYRRYHYMKIKMCLVGWVIPGLLILLWVGIEHKDLINLQKSFQEIPAIVCIITPIYLVIFLNLIMTTHVLYHFGHMMRDEDFLERRLARATLVLSFLLGINFIVPFIARYLVSDLCAIEIITFFEDIVSCIQGLFVSIFILQNEEVLQCAKRCIKIPRMIQMRGSSRSSRSSHGSTVNTTGSGSNKPSIDHKYQPCIMEPQSPSNQT
ncbi:vasoactive intestinal polypeptide receptor 1-like [Amphiura filiformis]|uniref:vasoactive intestinal polypeptide receptor 1-like n=1 Tax=Amphiura filiformis TaxID=82378 RepID=UPI003B21CDD7